jgi:hypothetical protein
MNSWAKLGNILIKIDTVITQMQEKVFYLNFILKYIGSSYICVWSAELDHAKPDYSEQDHVELNQGLHHRIIMCTQKREDSMTEVN